MADSMSPSFMRVGPDGSVGADFVGHVHAQGLDLDENLTGATSAEDSVSWLDPGGVIREQLTGVLSGGLHNLLAIAGGQKLALISSNGSSAFVQLPVQQKTLIDFGTDTAPTAGANSATVAVAHDLFVVPATVLVLPRTNPNAIAQVTARSQTQFTVQIAHRDAAPVFAGNIAFDWLVIG